MKLLLLLLLCATSAVFAQEAIADGSTTTGVNSASSEKGTTQLHETTAESNTIAEGATNTMASTSLAGDASTSTIADNSTETPSLAADNDNATTSPTSTDEATTSASTESKSVASTEPSTPEIVTTPSPAKPPSRPPYVNDDFVVKNTTSNVTCLKVKIALQFEVTYNQTNQQSVQTYINVPANATVASASSCGEERDVLSLTWEDWYSLTLTFSNNKTEKKYGLHKIHFGYMINWRDFPGAEDENQTAQVNKTIPLDSKLSGSLDKSYKCDAADKLQLSENVTMTWQHAQVQAFMTADTFSTAEDCAPDDKTDDIVPIAVGCALAGLVIIVLIAYMVGRRRSRQKGYQSV